ncbi:MULTISPECIES: RDD family protein [unclassified Streptomyces]|uniref:RDD family protein n=1 Tax=unclassified Streptomyces TaxID=2593676 RepID=UPI002E21DBFA|nr:RDD family protein [Streptomyces sp. NBC_01023]
MDSALFGTRPEAVSVHYIAGGEATGPGVLVLAGPLRRIAARLIDLVVLTAFAAALCTVAAVAFDVVDPEAPDGAAFLLSVLLLVGVPVVTVRIHVRVVHRWGCSLGKRLCGLRVLPLWTDGTVPLTRRAAAVREAALCLATVIPVANVVIGVPLLVMLLSNRPYWQSKFDRAADTVLVRWPAVNG